MGESVIALTGIRAQGRHGANPGERDAPQEFVVDVRVEVTAAADALAETADYAAVAGLVRETVAATSFVLLETLAGAVATAVRACPGVRRATVVVHKPGAAGELGIGDVAVEATRG